ncbi:hypothetical protein AU255_02115 [Methyloprofundus sedimenti]|uniref:Lysylphosphatidylglycerol synthetase n=1 Tax=Methyloprofundus sedimenti TaxID=1420851 RepID=A0A1V8M590_9GAMM|nr:hypothetical protein [Methyloprofundus sedimenti]OQK16725.1 hypothetical protein AU255_02115 [Methyloprofundus sedimenti]
MAIISLGFVGVQLSENWDKVGAYQFTFASLAGLLLGAVVYAGACFFLSSAWYQILSAISSHSLSVKLLRSIYARSQIAKYIPGNVMHIASRHIMLNRLGISHKPLAVASLAEMIGLVSAAVTFAIIGGTLYDLWGEYLKPQLLYIGLAVIAMLLVLLPLIRIACLKYIPASHDLLKKPRLQGALFRAYLEYLLFFALAGAILVALVFQLDGYVSSNSVFAILASFAISWLAGFITPGAPSGIGIRETILVVSLDKILLAGNGALIAILFRFMTVSGDVLFFIIAGGRK